MYYAIARRANDLAVTAVKKKTVLGISRSMADPEVQHVIAEMSLEMDGVGPNLDRIAEDRSPGAAYGDAWPANIVGATYHAVESAKRDVDLAMETSGGARHVQR